MDKIVYAIQNIVKQSINTSKFSDIVFGTVTSINPLKIKITDTIILEEENIYLTTNVKDYEIDVTVSMNTENTTIDKVDNHTHNITGQGVGNMGAPVNVTGNALKSSDIDSTHKHQIKDKKKIKIHSALKKNEKVLMIKGYGSQRYVVLDRLSEYECEGEWIK